MLLQEIPKAAVLVFKNKNKRVFSEEKMQVSLPNMDKVK